jgi:predicted TIM-barrel fold metal-dependent hydrolase
MIIDTHVHLIRPFDSRGKPHIYSAGNPTSAEDYAALMDASGIDRAFFISWSPEDLPSELDHPHIDQQNAHETMSREYALEVMARFPERFYWFPCHLGPALGDAAAMARENLKLGAAGLKLVCSFWGELPDDERLLPLYQLADDYRAQIIIDTSYWYLGKDDPADPDTLQAGHRDVARRVKDFPDHLTHLAPVVSAHPRVNFQLAHAGARSFTPEHAAEVGRFIRSYPNVFADLGALPPDSTALECLVESAGADRVMFGTDWPHFAQGQGMRQAIDHIRRPGRFPDKTAAMILGDNALRFVGGRAPG